MSQTLEGLQTEILGAIARLEATMKEDLAALRGDVAEVRAAVQVISEKLLAEEERPKLSAAR